MTADPAPPNNVEPLPVSTSRPGFTLPFVHTTIDAELVTERGGHRVLLSIDETEVELPPLEDLAFYVGLSALAGFGLVELPVAATIGVGHLLIGLTRRPGLQVLGEVLEEV